mgnify:CR=1 FL=1
MVNTFTIYECSGNNNSFITVGQIMDTMSVVDREFYITVDDYVERAGIRLTLNQLKELKNKISVLLEENE